MSHFSSIHLENFRIFKEPVDFEFRPITVLTGPNGSGKSSLIKALKLVQGNFEPLVGDTKAFWSQIDFRVHGGQLGDYQSTVNQFSDREILTFRFPFVLTGVRDPLEITYEFEPDTAHELNQGRLRSWYITRPEGPRPVVEASRSEADGEASWIFKIDFRYLRGELDAWVNGAAESIRAARENTVGDSFEGSEDERGKKLFYFYEVVLQLKQILEPLGFTWEEIKLLINRPKQDGTSTQPQRREFPRDWEARVSNPQKLWRVKKLLVQLDIGGGDSDWVFTLYPHLHQDKSFRDLMVHNRQLALLSGLKEANATYSDYQERKPYFDPGRVITPLATQGSVMLPELPLNGYFPNELAWPQNPQKGDLDETGAYYNPQMPLLAYYFLLDPSVFSGWSIEEEIAMRLGTDYPEYRGPDFDKGSIAQEMIEKELAFLNSLSMRIREDERPYEGNTCLLPLAEWTNSIDSIFPDDSMLGVFDNRDKDHSAEAQLRSQDDLSFDYILHDHRFVDIRISLAKRNGTAPPLVLPEAFGNVNENITYFFKDFIYRNLVGSLKALHHKFGDPGHIFFLEGVRGIQSRLYTADHSQLALKRLIDQMVDLKEAERQRALDFLNPWVQKFGMGDRITWKNVAEGYALQLFLEEGDSHRPLTDHGYGYAQLLPILLQVGIIASQYQKEEVAPSEDSSTDNIEENTSTAPPTVLIIEEPETNLHPKLQSLLADFFVDAAKQFRIQLILETHSEYLIRKMQYLTAKGEITPEDTALYYFFHPEQVPKDRKQVERLRINQDGRLDKDFGPGFFDESARWIAEIWKLSNPN